MDTLAFLLNPLVVVFIAGLVVVFALRPQQRARARAQAVAEQTPALTELASKLGGSLSGPGEAAAWTPRLQRSRFEPELTLSFQCGPWHVRVTEASVARMDKNLLAHEHWVEVATMPLPARELTFEFFELSFEDGFVHALCGGQVRADEIEFLVGMIIETLDRMPGVQPRDPTAVL